MPKSVRTRNGKNYRMLKDEEGTDYFRETSPSGNDLDSLPLYRRLGIVYQHEVPRKDIELMRSLSEVEDYLSGCRTTRELRQGNTLVGIAVDADLKDLYPERAPIFIETAFIVQIRKGGEGTARPLSPQHL